MTRRARLDLSLWILLALVVMALGAAWYLVFIEGLVLDLDAF